MKEAARSAAGRAGPQLVIYRIVWKLAKKFAFLIPYVLLVPLSCATGPRELAIALVRTTGGWRRWAASELLSSVALSIVARGFVVTGWLW